MMKSPKHADHFEINNMGAVKLLPRWLRSRRVANTNRDRKGRICCFTKDGHYAGKIIFRNQALTGRALTEIGKHQKTLQELNDANFS